jgi:DNA-directed RNA polymerase specialized sigma24 family protein
MTLDNFDDMLVWLDPDRQGAVVKYEKIHSRIIKIYTNRGCYFADEVADETDVRVCRKIKKIVAKWKEGDNPALYFYATAKKVYLELLRKKAPRALPPPPVSSAEKELLHACLDNCLDNLKPQQRELVLQFHEGEKQIRINNRKMLAEANGINPKALSLRAFRIHRELRKCMEECLKLAESCEVNSEFLH